MKPFPKPARRSKEARNRYRRLYKERHPDKVREYSKVYTARPEAKAARTAQHLKAKYNITLADYSKMLDSQGGVCAICCMPPGSKRLGVDHNHSTGAVRGLLCYACNMAIGLLHDNADRIRKAASYIDSTDNVG